MPLKHSEDPVRELETLGQKSACTGPADRRPQGWPTACVPPCGSLVILSWCFWLGLPHAHWNCFAGQTWVPHCLPNGCTNIHTLTVSPHECPCPLTLASTVDCWGVHLFHNDFKGHSLNIFVTHVAKVLHDLKNILFIYLFLERGERREKEEERRQYMAASCVPSTLGTWPTTQACGLTRNGTSDPLVHRLTLNPLSHTSQGTIYIYIYIFLYIYIYIFVCI